MSDNFIDYLNELDCFETKLNINNSCSNYNPDDNKCEILKDIDTNFLLDKYLSEKQDEDIKLYDDNFLDINPIPKKIINKLDKVDDDNFNNIIDDILDENYSKQYLPEITCNNNMINFWEKNKPLTFEKIIAKRDDFMNFDYSTKPKNINSKSNEDATTKQIYQLQNLYYRIQENIFISYHNSQNIKPEILTPDYKLNLLKNIFKNEPDKISIINDIKNEIDDYIADKNKEVNIYNILRMKLNSCREIALKFVIKRYIGKIKLAKTEFKDISSNEKLLDALINFILDVRTKTVDFRKKTIKIANTIIKDTFIKIGHTIGEYNSIINDPYDNPIENFNLFLTHIYLKKRQKEMAIENKITEKRKKDIDQVYYNLYNKKTYNIINDKNILCSIVFDKDIYNLNYKKYKLIPKVLLDLPLKNFKNSNFVIFINKKKKINLESDKTKEKIRKELLMRKLMIPSQKKKKLLRFDQKYKLQRNKRLLKVGQNYKRRKQRGFSQSHRGGSESREDVDDEFETHCDSKTLILELINKNIKLRDLINLCRYKFNITKEISICEPLYNRGLLHYSMINGLKRRGCKVPLKNINEKIFENLKIKTIRESIYLYLVNKNLGILKKDSNDFFKIILKKLENVHNELSEIIILESKTSNEKDFNLKIDKLLIKHLNNKYQLQDSIYKLCYKFINMIYA